MADNKQSEAVVSGGATWMTASGSWSGDTVDSPGSFQVIVSGSEGSWTFAQVVGGAGAVAAGVQRMTLASDDPAVVDLAAIEVLLTGIDADTDAIKTSAQLLDNAISGAGFNITQLAGASVPIGAGVEATAVRVTIATDSTGVLSIDDNGAAITVDNGGTFAVQAAQSGTWNITNVSGTVSLPTGASTAAKQPALGTAGTASTDVITVQGIASMTPLLATITFASAQAVTQSGTWTVDLGATDNAVLDAIAASVAGTLTVGTHAVTQSGTWNVGTVTTVTTVSTVTNLSQMGGAAIAMGTGTRSAGTQRVTIATDDVVPASQSGTWTVDLGATDNAVLDAIAASLALIDNAIPSGNELQVDVVAALPAGTNLLGRVNVEPQTGNGLSIFRSIDLDEGTLEVVKGSPGAIYGGMVTNTATSTRFIKFYDATSGTLGTGTPVITWGIPGNSSDDIGALFNTGGMGVAFSTGICVGASTGVADNDTGAPGANEVILNLFFK